MAKSDNPEHALTAGLEIHQQLNTSKLFCACPSLLRNDTPLRVVERQLNPVAGETGKIDIAAAFEHEKGLKFHYEFFDTNCLVELDEEPPHAINPEALKTTLQIALLLNCKIFPVSQVMRKTVIDGSNTSGFQRTALIGYDGYIETSAGRVGIETIALEEDAARPAAAKDGDGEIEGGNTGIKRWKLDRLGIPLVEITTKPDLHSPEQIKEAALKLGEIIRACNVRRGIGTIRQDVNISIPGSDRVEIKGFQDPKIMIKTVELEIERQKECIKNKKCVKEVRKSNPDGSTSFLRPMPGSARMYPETDLPLLKISREMLNDAKATLPALKEDSARYLKELGLNDELVNVVLQERKLEQFKNMLTIINNPALIAKALTIFPKEISSKEKKSLSDVEKTLTPDIIEAVLEQVNKSIAESDVRPVLQKIAGGYSLQDALVKEKVNVAAEVSKLVKEKPSLNANAYMGLLMAKFKGSVSGKEVMDEINKALPK